MSAYGEIVPLDKRMVGNCVESLPDVHCFGDRPVRRFFLSIENPNISTSNLLYGRNGEVLRFEAMLGGPSTQSLTLKLKSS